MVIKDQKAFYSLIREEEGRRRVYFHCCIENFAQTLVKEWEERAVPVEIEPTM